jgi:hypothetical protein
LLAMLSGHNTEESAKISGLSRTSAWRVRKSEAFQMRFKEARAELLNGAVNELYQNAGLFVRTLAAVCADAKARGSEKATAADRGLGNLLKAIELIDISERLLKLERAAGSAEETNL